MKIKTTSVNLFWHHIDCHNIIQLLLTSLLKSIPFSSLKIRSCANATHALSYFYYLLFIYSYNLLAIIQLDCFNTYIISFAKNFTVYYLNWFFPFIFSPRHTVSKSAVISNAAVVDRPNKWLSIMDQLWWQFI